VSIVLQLNSVSAQSGTGIKFLANFIDRGDAVLPAYSDKVTDKSVVIWLDKQVNGKALATTIESRIAEAKSAGKVYHLTLSAYRVDIDEPTVGKDGIRVYQAVEVKPASGASISGAITDRLVVEVGNL
jgi:hypothetical protein